MHELIAAAIFLLFIASPAIAAACPATDKDDRPRGLRDCARVAVPACPSQR
jgi:hypothetical protein